MRSKLMLSVCVLILGALASGCSSANTNNASNTTNANASNTTSVTNTSTTTTTATNTSSGEYDTTITNDDVVRIETRAYRNNPRISKVEITTRNGKRTARVTSTTGETRDIPEEKVESVINGTADAIADAAGFVTDKSKEAASTVKEGGEKALDKGKEGAQKVAEGAKTVGEKAVDGTKTAAEKTAEGAKKAGKAVKNAVTP